MVTLKRRLGKDTSVFVYDGVLELCSNCPSCNSYTVARSSGYANYYLECCDCGCQWEESMVE